MTVKAIYRNGVFEPVDPVNLPEMTPVDLEVSPSPLQSVLADNSGKRLSLGLTVEFVGDFKELGPEWDEYLK